eukprot:764967-Hanusia_phi.AAC.3
MPSRASRLPMLSSLTSLLHVLLHFLLQMVHGSKLPRPARIVQELQEREHKHKSNESRADLAQVMAIVFGRVVLWWKYQPSEAEREGGDGSRRPRTRG